MGMKVAYQNTIDRLADTFKKKAAALSTSNKAEATLFHGDEGHTFLMDYIVEKLDKDEWDDEDAAKLSAAFFLLLTCDETEEDEEEDDEESLI